MTKRKSVHDLPLWLGLVAALSPFSPAFAARDFTDDEWQRVPRYCMDTMGIMSRYHANGRHWIGVMGPSFSHMHHYCWALMYVNRAAKSIRSEREKQDLWGLARNDYQYVVNNATPDFVMLPEVYTRLGEVELLRGFPEKAAAAFAEASKRKPDYWPAYARWAEYLRSKGKRSEALEVVVAGLEHAPQSRTLQELFRLLGGKAKDLPVKAEARDESPPSPATPAPPEGTRDGDRAEEIAQDGDTAPALAR